MLGLLLAAVITAGGYDPGGLLCTVEDPRIGESSGIVTSASDDDLLFTHNDSGDTARYFELDRRCHTLATILLSGVQARDWEDVSRGPGQTLWFGDIGDNSASRDRGILVHRVPEPGRVGGTVRQHAVSYRLRYDDGPHDAEALLVHPRTGQLLVVTKGFVGAQVYAAPLPLQVGTPNVLHRVASVAVAEVTGGDIAPDGSRVVLRNYTAAYEWDVDGDDVVGALRGQPARIPLPRAPQGEGISYTRDGNGLVLSSEGAGAPVQELRRLPVDRASEAPRRAAGVRHRWDPTVGMLAPAAVMAAVVVVAVLALGLLGARRRRRRA